MRVLAMEYFFAALLTGLTITINLKLASHLYTNSQTASPRMKISSVSTVLSSMVFAYLVLHEPRNVALLPLALVTYSIIQNDLVEMRIPNRLTLHLALSQSAAALISRFDASLLELSRPILIGLVTLLGFLFLNVISRNQLGMGDVKLTYSLAVAVTLIDPNLILTMILLSFTFAGLFASCLLILKMRSKKTFFPFGPFLVIATWLTLYVSYL